ncbi:TIR domain-containing adapter molecule 1 [Elephas maximus indicus]|uniref:TIR domain-containing adapter molecule 1 n=1 Tax=Elephas maximus indicus TaxID=99487 RepID=UPI00211622CA|nr:TIR domain-containing adapter molecule 1 [Elephas maximus indicus]XP_049732434.1 TIR domain-containing adapter molecule 1 [Elephas maximus indicus]XP_049732435.1 TIR domain-containing adapter molecule 1 [Elephas maximus indicus]
MADTEPSLPGAFDILRGAGQDKLLHLKHKLKTLHLSCQGASLLRAMVLLALGQDTEARLSLEMLRTDAAAQFVARRWASMDITEALEEPKDMSWTVACVYHLLAEEKLCPASLREAAYRAALQALSSMDDPRLPELQAEARDRCGWDVSNPGGFQPLHSHLGGLPPSSALRSEIRSVPQPIRNPSGWSQACSLKSTDSPASLASNLEISQSPTMLFLTQPHSPPRPSKLCDEPRDSLRPEPTPMGCQEPEQVNWPPSMETDPPQEPPHSPAPQLPVVAPDPSPAGLPNPSTPLESRAHYPEECTEVSVAPQSLPSTPQSLPSPVLDPPDNPTKNGTSVPLSVEDTASQKTKQSPPPPSAPQTSSPSHSASASPACAAPPASSSGPAPPELESSEQKFYNFVVLHARADEHVALRVRERLEQLGIPDGATFCEDFRVPGRGELSCLQDAIDHSAFTILLLTPNFDCRLSLHQVTQALMSSFVRHGWQDSVIPFQPLETSELSCDATRLLSSLVCLNEHSQLFERKVKNTFKRQKLQERKATWKKEQEVRAVREYSQHLEGERQHAAEMSTAYSAYLQSYLAFQAQMERLQVALGTQMSLGPQMPPGVQMPFAGQVPQGVQLPLPTWPGYPQPPLPPWLASTPPPAFPQPPSFLPVSPGSPQSPGLQPLIIHHAQMVQLGLNNHMWGQREAQAPEDKSQEAE